MGKLANLLSDEVARNTKTRCKLCRIIEDLDEEDQKSLKMIVDDHLLGPDKISIILRRSGFEISGTSVSRHQKNCNIEQD